MTIHTPQSSASTSSVSSSLTKRSDNCSMEISRSSAPDPQLILLQERMAQLETELVRDRADRVQVTERIGGLETRMAQMTTGLLEGVLMRIQEAANRVLDAQGKISMVEKRIDRCTNEDTKADLQDKHRDAQLRKEREMQILAQLRIEAQQKALELHMQLNGSQLRSDV